MEEEIYRRLAEHLDRLPGGFPPSNTGADLHLLRRLFTPEQAKLAVHLTVNREEAAIIAQRAGLPPVEAEQRLKEMAGKGLIFSVHPKVGPTLYQAIPWVVGIYESQVNNLSEGLRRAMHAYWATAQERPLPSTTGQMRTIPIGKSITVHLEALPYEQAEVLVQAQDRFAVTACICRRHSKLAGKGCDAPEESCLVFGDWADHYVRNGWGRYIERSAVMEILDRADAANLVLQPSNSKDISFICCCCGCCCGVLRGYKRHANLAGIISSPFIARLEPESCQGCWVCLDRCQMDALVADGDRVAHKADRCIGCGLCVSTCPSEALRLERRPASEQMPIPDSLEDAWHMMTRTQAQPL